MKETRHKKESAVLFHLCDVQGQTKASVIMQFIAMAVSGGGEGLIGKHQGKTFWKVKNIFVLIIDQTLDYMNSYQKLWDMLCP